MADEPTITFHLDLTQQVNSLVQAAEYVRGVMQKSGWQRNSEPARALSELIENIKRFSHQVTRREEEYRNLLSLADIGQVVNSSIELGEVLRIVMDTIVRLTGAERGFLMLRDEKGQLTIRMARNWEQESINASEAVISRSVINRVITEGQPVLTTNAQEDPRFGGQESIIAYHLRSILCVPLMVKGVITGVIYADHRVRTALFTASDRNLLKAFADQAAVAIENARLFESVRRTLAEVTELKNLMDNVFSSIASGVITADVGQKVILCNRATEAILGRPRSELVGHRLDEVLPPISIDLSQHVETVRRTDENLTGWESDLILPQRGKISLIFNLSPLKDAAQATQGVAIVVDDLTEKKRLEARSRLFGRMVSPKVIEHLDLDNLQLGGKRSQITTLFADVRGFTGFSERHDPEQLVSILNLYLAAAADEILKHEGMIDKFMGDAVMGLFNAPLPQKDHALRAVRAGLGIRDAIRALHHDLPAEFHLAFGVGIHYGDVVLGLVGTKDKIEYTAIGDSVNTAKRIQENAAANMILISADAYNLVSAAVEVRQVEPIIAKGKRAPVEVFEVVGLKG